jgi:hypothetical protein
MREKSLFQTEPKNLNSCITWLYVEPLKNKTEGVSAPFQWNLQI